MVATSPLHIVSCSDDQIRSEEILSYSDDDSFIDMPILTFSSGTSFKFVPQNSFDLLVFSRRTAFQYGNADAYIKVSDCLNNIWTIFHDR